MRKKVLFAVNFCLLTLSSSFADMPAQNSQELDLIKQLEKKVVEHTLKNGLRILILERPTAPIVSFQLSIRVGAVDDMPGKTGLAHLFEHMMFKGSKLVGTTDYEKEKPVLEDIDHTAQAIMAEEENTDKDKNSNEKLKSLTDKMKELNVKHHALSVPSEFETIYKQEGAEGLHAFTTMDMTSFMVSLPSSRWELWPIMESDRMANPVPREFYKEKDVVKEERLMRVENSQTGMLWEALASDSFRAHPYGSPAIGWMSDLGRLTQSDAEKFFQNRYGTSNTTIVVVGRIKAKEVIGKFESYFSKVPSKNIPDQAILQEPSQNGERRMVVRFDSEPMLMLGFHKPNPPHADNYAMEVIEQLLGRGRTSRLNLNIVDKEIALSIWVLNKMPGERYLNLIVIAGSPRKPYGNKDLEKAILKEIERLKKEKVPEEELLKIRDEIEADKIRNMGSTAGIAAELAYAQTVLGDWHYPFNYLEEIRKISPEDIQRVAKRYFSSDNMTVAYLQRTGSELNE